jgi:glutamate--cysteine ligase
MARDQVDMTPIETREELIAWFEAGSKPKSQFRIGTEHEKFVFAVEGHNPVPYDGRLGGRVTGLAPRANRAAGMSLKSSRRRAKS